MPFSPSYLNHTKLPKFQSSDKGLEDALNLLARAIEQIEIPDIRLANGNMAWSGRSIILTPDPVAQRASTPVLAHPWKPTFFTEGNQPKVRFNLGTINNVPATNWNAAHTLTMGDNEFHFVIATVSTSDGLVSGLTLSVEATAPATDSISKDVPPSEHKIILGAVGKSTSRMIETANLNLFGQLVFIESKAAPAVGAEPYSRWWRWAHTSI